MKTEEIQAIVKQLKPGTVVNIVDDWLRGHAGCANTIYTTGNVSHLTKTQIVVQTRSGSEMRFRVKDLNVLGYHYVHFAFSLRLGTPVQPTAAPSSPA